MIPVSVPVFPLPGLVLFPRTIIPLHVFEPRYVRLVKDAMAGDRRLATGHLRKGWEKDYYGAPPIHRIVTIARLLHEERLPGDRFNIILEGIERALVVEESRHHSYRLLKANPIVDSMPEADMPAIQEGRRELVAMAEQLARQTPDLRGALTNLENTHLHPGIIADQVASLIVKDAYERQSLLEQQSVRRRIELVNVQLRARLVQYEDSAVEPE